MLHPIRKYRENLGVTRAMFARAAGLHVSSMAMIERSEQHATTAQRKAIAAVMGLSPERLARQVARYERYLQRSAVAIVASARECTAT